MEMSKQFQHFRQLVGRVDDVGLLNHVRTHINQLVTVSAANICDFRHLTLARPHVNVQFVPGQHSFRNGKGGQVTFTRELVKSILHRVNLERARRLPFEMRAGWTARLLGIATGVDLVLL